jgi:hypothetical protein
MKRNKFFMWGMVLRGGMRHGAVRHGFKKVSLLYGKAGSGQLRSSGARYGF